MSFLFFLNNLLQYSNTEAYTYKSETEIQTTLCPHPFPPEKKSRQQGSFCVKHPYITSSSISSSMAPPYHRREWVSSKHPLSPEVLNAPGHLKPFVDIFILLHFALKIFRCILPYPSILQFQAAVKEGAKDNIFSANPKIWKRR